MYKIQWEESKQVESVYADRISNHVLSKGSRIETGYFII